MAPTCARVVFTAGLLNFICGCRHFPVIFRHPWQEDPFGLLGQPLLWVFH